MLAPVFGTLQLTPRASKPIPKTPTTAARPERQYEESPTEAMLGRRAAATTAAEQVTPTKRRRNREGRKKAKRLVTEEPRENPIERVIRGAPAREEEAKTESEEGEAEREVIEVSSEGDNTRPRTFLHGPETQPVLSLRINTRLNELLDSLPKWKLHNNMSPRDVFNHLKLLVSYLSFVRSIASKARDEAAHDVKNWCTAGHYKVPDLKQASGHYTEPSDPPRTVDA